MARDVGDAAVLSHALNNVGTALWDDGAPEGQSHAGGEPVAWPWRPARPTRLPGLRQRRLAPHRRSRLRRGRTNPRRRHRPGGRGGVRRLPPIPPADPEHGVPGARLVGRGRARNSMGGRRRADHPLPRSRRTRYGPGPARPGARTQLLEQAWAIAGNSERHNASAPPRRHCWRQHGWRRRFAASRRWWRRPTTTCAAWSSRRRQPNWVSDRDAGRPCRSSTPTSYALLAQGRWRQAAEAWHAPAARTSRRSPAPTAPTPQTCCPRSRPRRPWRRAAGAQGTAAAEDSASAASRVVASRAHETIPPDSPSGRPT